MSTIREVVSVEIYNKACAERDAFKDLVCLMAISTALYRYGSIGHGKNVMIGDYVFRVWNDKGGPRAEVVAQ